MASIDLGANTGTGGSGGGGGGSGTVTQVNTGGLATGGPITNTGTITVSSISLITDVTGSLPLSQTTGSLSLSNRVSGSLPLSQTTGSVDLTNQVVNNLPLSQTSGSISLTGQVSGILPIANGGTGASSVPNQKLVLVGPIGHGSGNTCIRRYGTVFTNTIGSSATYLDSVGSGMSITITQAGIYSIFYNDFNSGANGITGVSINASGAALASAIFNAPVANRLGYCGAATSVASGFSSTTYLAVNDVVRAHDDGGCNATQSFSSFVMVKIFG